MWLLSMPLMNEYEALYKRRLYLLERIGMAADEINRIDERLASLQSSPGRDTAFGAITQP